MAKSVWMDNRRNALESYQPRVSADKQAEIVCGIIDDIT